MNWNLIQLKLNSMQRTTTKTAQKTHKGKQFFLKLFLIYLFGYLFIYLLIFLRACNIIGYFWALLQISR